MGIEGGTPAAVIMGNDAYHTGCMTCATCNETITGAYTEENGHLVHVKCREEKICGKCGEEIKGEAISVSEKKFHPECFKCYECKKEISGSFRTTADGERICAACIKLKKCFACKKGIERKSIAADGKDYHPECFKCQKCEKQLGEKYLKNDVGEILCDACASEDGSVLRRCVKCEELIKEGIVLFGKDQDTFHEACFTCHECNNKMDEFGVWEEGGKRRYLCVTCVKKKQEETAGEVVVKTTRIISSSGTSKSKKKEEQSTPGICLKCKKGPNEGEEMMIFRDKSTIHFSCFRCDVCKSVPEKNNNLGRRQVLALLEGRYTCIQCRKNISQGIQDEESLSRKPKPSGADTPPKTERIPQFGLESKASFNLNDGSAGIIKRAPIDKSFGAIAPCDEEKNLQEKNDLMKIGTIQSGDVTIADLRNREFCEKNDIDLKVKEKYISDDLFPSLFGMSREAFDKEPLWKKNKKKQEIGIF